ncbi:MAG: hypothetical protein PVS3B2_14370 [Candidatus Dormibacteraceae bacterium]
MPGRKVQLVLSVARPFGKPSLAPRDEQADGKSYKHYRLDDSLDDDDLDERVVLAPKGSQLSPETFEVVRPAPLLSLSRRVRGAPGTA